MSVKEINKTIAAAKEQIAELNQSIKEIQNRVEELRAERLPLILKGKFTWRGKMYKVSDIQILNNYSYDDCPYTPGWDYCDQTIEFRQEGEANYQRVSLCGEDRGIGNAAKHLADYREFLVYFLKKFGESVYDVIKIKENKTR